MENDSQLILKLLGFDCGGWFVWFMVSEII
jgi:hypothetical protein